MDQKCHCPFKKISRILQNQYFKKVDLQKKVFVLFCRENVENNPFEKMYLHKTKKVVTNKGSVGFSIVHCQSEGV